MSKEREKVSIEAILPEKDNIFVCRDCGRENVEEKAWTSINDHLIVNGKYYAYITDIDNPSSNYCYDCADECDVVSREDYLEEKE